MSDAKTQLLAEQLARMRGMTGYYHDRFFADTRFFGTGMLALLIIGWWGIPEAFLLVPFVALLGANMTAFDASYLIFARTYAATIEDELNSDMGAQWLIAADMEDAYLFPLDKKKIVTIRLGSEFSWFGWMTILTTTFGAGIALAGLALGWDVVMGFERVWTAAYLASLALTALGSVVVGFWWFYGGVGEGRLSEVIADRFGKSLE